jgi:hypothetical protein
MPSAELMRIVLYAGTALQFGVAIAMLLRRSYRQLPVFFTYSIYIAIRAVALPLLDRHPYAAFYAYWATEVIAWALCLAAIQEIVQRLCGSYPAISRLVTILFRWGAALLIALSLFTAYAAPGSDPTRLLAGILTLERSVRILQVGLLSLLFVFARFLRLRWPHYAFGVAFGFAIFCSVELASVTVRAHDMWAHNKFAIIGPLAFVTTQLIWLLYLAAPEPVSDRELQPSPAMAGWEVALAELLRR